MKVPALLKNKYVCYALMALATLNVIGYVSVKAWECLALFTLTGYSAHCYCKDVSCAILAALFVANFVFGCGRVKEGFEDALKGPKELLTEAHDILEKAEDKETDPGVAKAIGTIASSTETVAECCKDGEGGNCSPEEAKTC